MAALVLRPDRTFDAEAFAAWLDAQPDLSPKWRPRYVRVAAELPTTPTNKILTRTLVHEKFRRDRVGADPVYVRERLAAAYRPFDEADEESLQAAFAQNGRAEAWDL
jgi:fatty-acyl-CoA synthase